MNICNRIIKNKKRLFFVAFIFFEFYSTFTFSQTKDNSLGYYIGINTVPTSFSNLSATGREIGVFAIKKINRKFEFQANVSLIRKKIKLVPARYNNEYARGNFYLKPKYNVFEIASLLNYYWYEKKNGAQVKIIGGISFNFNNAVKYSFGVSGFRGPLGASNETTEEDGGGRNVTANIVIGLSTNKIRKKNGRPITWTLLYQKAVLRSPTVHISGNLQLNSDPVIHYNYTITPYLDLLCIRISFLPNWQKLLAKKEDGTITEAEFEEERIAPIKQKSVRMLD